MRRHTEKCWKLNPKMIVPVRVKIFYNVIRFLKFPIQKYVMWYIDPLLGNVSASRRERRNSLQQLDKTIMCSSNRNGSSNGTATEERRFLCSPYRGVLHRTSIQFSQWYGVYQWLSDRKYYMVTNSRGDLTSRHTDWLTVCRNMTLTLTLTYT
jgi:hypothetical protein